MKCIGENLNVMNKSLAQAFADKNPEPIEKIALSQKAAGVDWIDINIGPARKNGAELMTWLVTTVQNVVPDMPLSLDTINIEAMEAGLAAHKGTALVNSVMAKKERYEALLPLVVKYQANMIALLWGEDGLPRDENERAALCVELVYVSNEAGVANDRIFIDPIITPLNIQQNQLMSTLAFMEMLPEIAPGVRSTCGLSNMSNGTPLRAPLNQTFMLLLERVGMYSCILDFEDKLILNLANGCRPDITKVVYDTADGLIQDPSKVDKELQIFVKATRVIIGQSLYSDSWMDL